MNNMKLLLLLFSFAFNNHARAENFNKMGTYLLEYSIFKVDIYQITYFKSENSEKLVLEYKRSVKKEHSIEGWRVGLKHKLNQSTYALKAQWLYDHTFDTNKGDILTILKKDKILEMYINEKLIGSTSDPVVAELAFEPWLGAKPVDEVLKASLLGLK